MLLGHADLGAAGNRIAAAGSWVAAAENRVAAAAALLRRTGWPPVCSDGNSNCPALS